jgi:hypothetical protein
MHHAASTNDEDETDSDDEDHYMSDSSENDHTGDEMIATDVEHIGTIMLRELRPPREQLIEERPSNDEGLARPVVDFPSTFEEAEFVAYMFDPHIEYQNEDEVDIFDDGLEGDETSDSEMSVTFEELEEPTVITKVLRVSEFDGSEQDSDTGAASTEASFDDQKDPWDSEDLDSSSENQEAKEETPDTDTTATEKVSDDPQDLGQAV